MKKSIQKKSIQYAESQFEEFLGDLIEFLKIPSISTDSSYTNDVNRCAQWLVDHLAESGICDAELIRTDGHPIVYGNCPGTTGSPTLMVYGHYDVQPPEPVSEWHSDPFDPSVRNGSIFARGASDDKGQLFAILKGVQSILKGAGRLPCCVKFLIEGEEETGSTSIKRFIRDNRDKLASDSALVCDTAMITENIPAITVSLRGNVYIELNMRGPRRDLHSGVYGGAVENPLHILCDLISGLHDKNNRITLPHFYDEVIEMGLQERQQIAEIPFDEKAFLAEIGVAKSKTEKGYTVLESTTARPALDVHGIWGGFSGEGGKTIIPATAGAKLSFRTVPDQKAAKVFSGLKSYLETRTPDTLRFELSLLNSCDPVQIDVERPAMQAALNALQKTFRTKPYFTREGGSIPIVSELKRELNVDSILMGFGLEEDAIHAPDEHFGLDRFRKGVEAVVRFIGYYGDKKI